MQNWYEENPILKEKYEELEIKFNMVWKLLREGDLDQSDFQTVQNWRNVLSEQSGYLSIARAYNPEVQAAFDSIARGEIGTTTRGVVVCPWKKIKQIASEKANA